MVTIQVADNTLSRYMRDVSRHPLLTAEEEYDLAINKENKRAREKLINANLRLVVKIAMELGRNRQQVMDLVQEGNIGLMRAVAKFDPKRGPRLSSYAAWWIRAFMMLFMTYNRRLVRVGKTAPQRILILNLDKERGKLLAQGIDPTPEVLAQRLKVPVHDVKEMSVRLSNGGEVSLDMPVAGLDGATLQDCIAANVQAMEEFIDEKRARESAVKKVKGFRQTLEGRDLDVFDGRMADVEQPKTLGSVGDKYGITRERVRQVQVKITSRMKGFLNGEPTTPAGKKKSRSPSEQAAEIRRKLGPQKKVSGARALPGG